MLTAGAGPRSLAVEKHLAACSPCRAELASLSGSLSAFRTAATGASALYTPSQLLRSHTSIAPSRFSRPRAAWAAGLVAAAALCTVSISALHKPAAPAASIATEAPTEVSSAQSDDALLQSIDQDLSTSVPPSLAPLENISNSSATAETSTARTN